MRNSTYARGAERRPRTLEVHWVLGRYGGGSSFPFREATLSSTDAITPLTRTAATVITSNIQKFSPVTQAATPAIAARDKHHHKCLWLKGEIQFEHPHCASSNRGLSLAHVAYVCFVGGRNRRSPARHEPKRPLARDSNRDGYFSRLMGAAISRTASTSCWAGAGGMRA
jgi:hypothetical protein